MLLKKYSGPSRTRFFRKKNGHVGPDFDALVPLPGRAEFQRPSSSDRRGVEGGVSARLHDHDAVHRAHIRDAHLEHGASLDPLIPQIQRIGDGHRGAQWRRALDLLVLRATRRTTDEQKTQGQRWPSGTTAAQPSSPERDFLCNSNNRSRASLGVMFSGSSALSCLSKGGSTAPKNES